MAQTSQNGNRFHTRRIQTGGHAVDVHATFAPERPPIVLVHGVGMSAEYFQPYADVLADTHDVYSLDLPGYGKTPKPPAALTISELGDVLSGVVMDLSLVSPVIVGHSMGCQIVTDALAHNHRLCAGYILIGPTVDPAARSLTSLALRLFRDMLTEPFSTNVVVFRNYLQMGPIRHLRTVRHMLADRPEEIIQGCTAPGLIVRGAKDPVPSAQWVRELVRLAPDATLREVASGTHALQHNQPEELAEACRPFLAAVLGSGHSPQENSSAHSPVQDK